MPSLVFLLSVLDTAQAVLSWLVGSGAVLVTLAGAAEFFVAPTGSATGDVTLCMLMTGNTSDGSGVNAGIGLFSIPDK